MIDYSKMTDKELDELDIRERREANIDFSQMTDAKLEEYQLKKDIANDVKSLNSTDDWTKYLTNSAKLGLGDTISMLSGVADTMLLEPLKNIYNDPSIITNPDSYGMKNIPFTEDSRKGEVFARGMGQAQNTIAGITGADPTLTTEDDALKYAGRAVRTMSDPAGYIGAPVKAGAMLQRSVALGTIGASSAVGSDAGSSIEKTLTGEDTGVGSMIGGIGLGLSPSILSTVGARTVVAPVKEIWAKYKFVKANPGVAESQYATGAAKRLLKLIAKEQGVDDITDIVAEFNRLGKYIDGKELPLLVAMSDNPVVTSQVQRLAKTDESFRHEVNLELKRLAGQVDQKSNSIFGRRDIDISGLKDVPEVLHKKINFLVNQKYLVDTEIEDISLKLIPFMSAKKQGEAIRDLVVKREKIVKAKLSPLYIKLKADAKSEAVEISEEGVSSIHKHVMDNNLRDVFGKGTKLDKKIIKYTSPKESVNKSTGMKEVEAPTMSFEHLDSLKRAVNELKRKPLSDTEMRKLNDLDDVIREARKSMKGDYSKQLDILDKRYYEELGVPFNSASVKEIGAKRYADEVAPIILKNESALESFLNVAGSEGHVIARNAYYSKIYAKAVKDGEVNMPVLKAMLKKDKDMINTVPGLRQELEDTLVDHGSLFAKRAELNEGLKLAEDEIAKNFLMTSNLEPDFFRVVERSIRDHTYMDKVFKDLSKVDSMTAQAVTRRIQREFVEVALESSSGALKFISNPRNRTVVRKMFKDNPEYISQVRDLSKLSDALNKSSVEDLSSLVLNERLDWLAEIFPGLDHNYTFSQLRDRISSNTMKAFRLATRMNQASTKAKVDAQIKDILLHPQGLAKLSKTAKEFNFKIENPFQLKKILNIIGETLPTYVYASSKPTLLREENITQPEQQQIQ